MLWIRTFWCDYNIFVARKSCNFGSDSQTSTLTKKKWRRRERNTHKLISHMRYILQFSNLSNSCTYTFYTFHWTRFSFFVDCGICSSLEKFFHSTNQPTKKKCKRNYLIKFLVDRTFVKFHMDIWWWLECIKRGKENKCNEKG